MLPRVDAGSGEAVDVSSGRGNERDVDAPSDRMLVVGLRYRDAPPDREARGARGLLDLKLIERRRENRGGNRQVRDAKGDVVEHGGLAVEEVACVPVELLAQAFRRPGSLSAHRCPARVAENGATPLRESPWLRSPRVCQRMTRTGVPAMNAAMSSTASR
jgi:hypothetical protein